MGDAAQGVRLGAQLARKAGGATTRQAAKGVKTGATQLTKHTDSVLGRATHRCVLGNSFTAGTGVVTGVGADGGLLTTDIATLAVGDVVLANDQYTPGAEPRYALVTGVSHRTVHALHHVSYVTDAGESETLETTEGHEFYARRLTGPTGQTGWLKAQDLQPGDQLLTPDGTWATVTNNTLELAPAGFTVYNLTVSDGSTYYVEDGQGHASAVWVHNCGPGRHHLHPFSWGSAIKRGADALGNVLTKAQHNNVHRAFSKFLKQKTGYYFRSLTSKEWKKKFGDHGLRKLTAEFARVYGKTKAGKKLAETMYPGKNLTLYEALRAQWKYADFKGLKI
ncbi:MAG: polymorphic toxin-type HINT domain-containing protein [Phycisphaeraceae bacterium]